VSGGAKRFDPMDVGRDETIPSDPSRMSSDPPRFQSGARSTDRREHVSGASLIARESLHAPVDIGDIVAGKYQIERVLGRGGAGIVVAARNLDLDEPVALKFLRPDVAELPEVVARFAREAKSAVSIKNEHVCKVLDVGTLPPQGDRPGAPYMVMEYLEGRDLYRLMRERGALPISEAVEYVLQVCEALSFAHARGIIHRDVKPENIFLVESAEGIPYVKVLDFGISKGALTAHVANESVIKTGSLLGTPAYMSPEQIRATKQVDARTDIWAIGIVLYEILTAKAAFTADSVPQMAATILEQEPTSIRELRPEIPADLAAVINRCLAKDLNKRPRDVAELAAMLLPFAPQRARISVERASSVLHKTGGTPTPSLPTTAVAQPARSWTPVLAVIAVVAIGVVVLLLLRKPAPVVVPPPPPPTVVTVVATQTVTVTAAPTVTVAPSSEPSVPVSVSGTAKPKLTEKPKPKPSASGKASVDLGF
jgi:serine/threonine-protein kinase